MRLLLIRHGDPDYEHDGLTPAGRREAELLVPRMAGETITAFFVSTMGRARATARPTLEALGRTAEACDWLREFDTPVLPPDKNGEYIFSHYLDDKLHFGPEGYKILGARVKGVLDAL